MSHCLLFEHSPVAQRHLQLLQVQGLSSATPPLDHNIVTDSGTTSALASPREGMAKSGCGLGLGGCGLELGGHGLGLGGCGLYCL